MLRGAINAFQAPLLSKEGRLRLHGCSSWHGRSQLAWTVQFARVVQLARTVAVGAGGHTLKCVGFKEMSRVDESFRE